jgi:hypothetical protein
MKRNIKSLILCNNKNRFDLFSSKYLIGPSCFRLFNSCNVLLSDKDKSKFEDKDLLAKSNSSVEVSEEVNLEDAELEKRINNLRIDSSSNLNKNFNTSNSQSDKVNNFEGEEGQDSHSKETPDLESSVNSEFEKLSKVPVDNKLLPKDDENSLLDEFGFSKYVNSNSSSDEEISNDFNDMSDETIVDRISKILNTDINILYELLKDVGIIGFFKKMRGNNADIQEVVLELTKKY